MDCKVLNPGECLVKYFEDNKYSVVQFTDLQQFVPTTIPFLEFELAAGQKFLKNGGVVNALSYLESGKVKRKFSWHRWGTAQGQELNLDMHKHKPISLPLISDKAFNEKLQQLQTGVASSTSSSPTMSTHQDTDNETEGKNHTMHTNQSLQQYRPLLTLLPHLILIEEQSTASPVTVNSAGKGAGLKNGLQRALASMASTSSSLFSTTSLPSPVSLNDLATEPNIDETEFGLRPIKGKGETTAAVTKDSPTISTTTGRSRSRRGSRENENKAGATIGTPNSAVAIGTKDTSRRSRNASEQSSVSTSPTIAQPSPHASLMTTASNTASVTAPAMTDASKKQKSTTEFPGPTESQNGVSESGTVTTRSSRQGSAEPSVSPRSTRHSSRTSRASESNQQEHAEGTTESVEAASAAPTKLQTQRMTRQRSAPKSANSLSVSLAEKASNEDVKDELMEMASPVVKDEKESATLTMEVDSSVLSEQSGKTEQQGDKGESSAMDIDEQDSQIRSDQPPLSIPASSLASSASSTASPSSLGPDEGHVSSSTSASSALSSNSTLLQSLVQERQTMDYNFEFLLPKLAIGSKEREAFYETCMDHLQRLRQEHRRLKDILKSSDYLPKGRRATRSSPQYHSHHHRHNHHHHQSHVEEKPSRKRSPAPLRTNSQSSTGSHKETTTSRTSAKSKAESNNIAAQSTAAGAAEEDNAPGVATVTTSQSQSPPPPPPMYQGSTPSSDILTSNISTTTRRSAATAAAAALTATVSRSSRQSHHSNGKGSKKRNSTVSSASSSTTASAEAEAATGMGDDNGQVTTRAKRRLR
ncbi:hypothetical protein BGZ50_003054 [Haplosporangium sp. Z 11]|nr:hypothetical protein BGZ50_003054 [Haplosporangium sp. Z 11]